MTQASNEMTSPLPAKASMLRRLRVALHALEILRDDPSNPYYARVLHMSLDHQTYARLGQALRQSPYGRRLLDRRPTLPDQDLEALARLPEGTLGREYVRYFRDNGIEPFTFEFPLRSDADYLNKRYRETHDIHHLLTGYGTDEVGELELQAFYVGNLGLRHAALILLLSVPYQLAKDGLGWGGLRGLIGRMRAAYRRGKGSRELLSVSYDELWARPVSELSALLCAPAPAPA